MNLAEQRTLAALMFDSFRRHGAPVDSAVEQSLQAAELLILRSVARDTERREAEIERQKRDEEIARQNRALSEGHHDDESTRSYAAFPSS